ncbi:MAG TPA: ATP-binding protein, partial [Thermoleophilaceae bacterium]
MLVLPLPARPRHFTAWGKIFDDVTATAMIDRLVLHAEILLRIDDSYRLKDRQLARPARSRDGNWTSAPVDRPARPPKGANFQPRSVTHLAVGLDRSVADGAPAARAWERYR